jgi:hypothetical protein
MMLPAGIPVRVLTMEGGLTEASMIAATGTVLRLEGKSGPVEIAAADIVRVDRVGTGAAGREGLRGAVTGAAAVGVLGLISGRMPPARLWAAAGIVSAYHGVQMQGLLAGDTIVYLADWTIAPRRVEPAGRVRR